MKIDVTDLSYLILAIDESDLDEPDKEKMRNMIHNFSNQHSVLATAVKRANKNPILKILDRLIPPASERQGGTFDWEEKSVSKSTPKPKAAVKKSTPKKLTKPRNVDTMFDDVDDDILGFDD
tara:strand:- start:419 stop:784 length:366 start_codon:yes stop_codon:yes gene_type:complete